MRIVGGRFRGRALTAPETRTIRPTSDRLREMLFNILEHGHGDPCAGARVIDLFAGTGALGFEALSRGAAFTLFVDDGAEARACLRATVDALGVAGVTRIFRRDATKLGEAPGGPAFGLAFLDPPYGRGMAEPALAGLAAGGWLLPGAVCVVEEAAPVGLDLPMGFAALDRRVQGDTQLVICRYRSGALANPLTIAPG